MADRSGARVTGVVLGVDTRSGSKPRPDGTVNNWSMTSARVLVAGREICDVLIPDTVHAGRGEEVDWLVSISGGGRFVNIDYVGEWKTLADG